VRQISVSVALENGNNAMNSSKINIHRPIIVDCPSFNEDNGGAIVLHALVDQLRAIGVEAYAISLEPDYVNIKSPLIRTLKRWNWRRRKRCFKTHPSMDVPLVPKEIIDQAIVIYPETRSGNPLQSKRVVRWLLNKPSFFGIDAKISSNEEIFYYQEVFAEDFKEISKDRKLTVRWFDKNIYTDLGLPRSGNCRMIRKGRYTKGAIPQIEGEILLDGKSHIEIAHIFNTSERFYCHDPYTTYLYFAVLCGCIPIVVPQPGLSSEDWRAGMDLKNGVAYGEDEIQWAIDTSGLLKSDMSATKDSDQASLLQFLRIIRKIFS
jgi:hypothetical protein